jgi:Leucine-rich repeat (LRR) protein
LTHLDLGRNKLTHISGESLSSCQLLQSLILSQNDLTSLPAPLFLPNLKQFWCSGNHLVGMNAWAPDNACSISSISTVKSRVFLPMLEKLHLQDNAIDCIDIGVFCTMPHLNQLDLSFNNLTTIRSIAGLAVGIQPFALKQLQLQDNPLTRTTDPTRVLNDREIAEQLNKVHEWLMKACPGLTTLSNNKFPVSVDDSNCGRNSKPEDKSSGCRSLPASVVCVHDRTGVWSVEHIRNSRREQRQQQGQNQATSTSKAVPVSTTSALLSFEDAVSMQIEAAMQACNSVATSEAALSREGIEQLQNSSLISRQLINIVNTLALEQNSWRARERSAAAAAAAAAKDPKDQSSPGSSLPAAVPEDALVVLMRRQIQYLQDYGRQLLGHPVPTDATVLPITEDQRGEGATLLTVSTFGSREKDFQFVSHAPYSGSSTTNKAQTAATALQVSLQKAKEANGGDYSAVETSLVAGSQTGAQPGQITDQPRAPGSFTAATSLQKLYRGSRTRRLLSHALNSAKYYDQELDGMGLNDEQEDHDTLRELGLDELLKGDEFDPAWLHKREANAHNEYHQEYMDDADDGAEESDYDDNNLNNDDGGSDAEIYPSYDNSIKASGEVGSNISLVYGDLQRRRGSGNRAGAQVFPVSVSADENSFNSTNIGTAWGTPPPSALQQQVQRQTSFPDLGSKHQLQLQQQENAARFSPYHPSSSPRSRQLTSRPMSNSSDVSAMSMGSRMDNNYNSASVDHGYEEQQNDDDHSIPTVISRGPQKKTEVAEEWGISDPRLLNALMKRNKRMRLVKACCFDVLVGKDRIVIFFNAEILLMLRICARKRRIPKCVYRSSCGPQLQVLPPPHHHPITTRRLVQWHSPDPLAASHGPPSSVEAELELLRLHGHYLANNKAKTSHNLNQLE